MFQEQLIEHLSNYPDKEIISFIDFSVFYDQDINFLYVLNYNFQKILVRPHIFFFLIYAVSIK